MYRLFAHQMLEAEYEGTTMQVDNRNMTITFRFSRAARPGLRGPEIGAHPSRLIRRRDPWDTQRRSLTRS